MKTNSTKNYICPLLIAFKPSAFRDIYTFFIKMQLL